MRATKGNREYIIKAEQIKAYQNAGFDVKDDEGNVVAYGRGKTVPYETYMAVVKEKEALQERVDELQEKLQPTAEAPGGEPENAGKRATKKAGE